MNIALCAGLPHMSFPHQGVFTSPAPLQRLCSLPKADMTAAVASRRSKGRPSEMFRLDRSFLNAYRKLSACVQAVQAKRNIMHMRVRARVNFFSDTYFSFYLKIPGPPGQDQEINQLTWTSAWTALGPLGLI